MTLSERLKRTMQEKGITQQQLAELVNTTQGAISNLVNGEVQKPRNLLDIANALGVDPNWLKNGGEQTQNVAVMKGNKGDGNSITHGNTNYFQGVSANDVDRLARQLDRIEQKLDFLLQHMMANK